MNTLAATIPPRQRHVAATAPVGGMRFRRGRRQAISDTGVRAAVRRLPGAPVVYRAAMTAIAGTAPAAAAHPRENA